MVGKLKTYRTLIDTYHRLANHEARRLQCTSLTKGDGTPVTQEDIDNGWPNDEEIFQYWIQRRDATIAKYTAQTNKHEYQYKMS